MKLYLERYLQPQVLLEAFVVYCYRLFANLRFGFTHYLAAMKYFFRSSTTRQQD